MRIIAGQHRGRKLLEFDNADVRPTSDRLRQALFNILEHRFGSLEGAVVLDACCGTGALGLEALSRGAGRTVFLDQSSEALNLARQNALALKEAGKCGFVLSDVCNPPQGEAADLIFLDPPYGEDLAARALAALSAAGWSKVGGWAAVETQRNEPMNLPEGWDLLLERAHGAGKIWLLEKAS